MLRRARQFKASWIELAEALTESRRRGDFRRWGYDSFEDYTRRELFLRQETVDKLTGSFLFLKKRAPEVLARDGLSRTIPSYQVVDFLRRAETESDAPESTVGADPKARPRGRRGPPFGGARVQRQRISRRSRSKKRARPFGLAQRRQTTARASRRNRGRPRKLGSEVGKTLDRLLEMLRSAGERAA